jgi:hypothetical protein
MKAGGEHLVSLSPRDRQAHGPWSDLALHTIGWRAFQDLWFNYEARGEG